MLLFGTRSNHYDQRQKKNHKLSLHFNLLQVFANLKMSLTRLSTILCNLYRVVNHVGMNRGILLAGTVAAKNR